MMGPVAQKFYFYYQLWAAQTAKTDVPWRDAWAWNRKWGWEAGDGGGGGGGGGWRVPDPWKKDEQKAVTGPPSFFSTLPPRREVARERGLDLGLIFLSVVEKA